MVEITDEIVARYRAWWDGRGLNEMWPSNIKKALDAALNPPQEPEIVVTADMAKAGIEAWMTEARAGYDPGVSAIYRAMRKLESAQPLGRSFELHQRKGDMQTYPVPSAHARGPTAHRRATDPK